MASRAPARAPAERAKLYLDLVYEALTAATRTALEALMNLKNYEYKSDFARQYVAQGKAEGKAEGRAEAMAEAVLEAAAARGLVVSDAQREQVVGCRDVDLLRVWHRRARSRRRASTRSLPRREASRFACAWET